jgi:hypothetical protein
VNSGWVKIGTLHPDEILVADPTGRAKCHRDAQPLGPEGTDNLAPNPELRIKLPLPEAPPYSVIVKLGANGTPGILAGRYATTFTAVEPIDIYVRVNDFEPDIPHGEPGYSDNEGQLPIIIKRHGNSR